MVDVGVAQRLKRFGTAERIDLGRPDVLGGNAKFLGKGRIFFSTASLNFPQPLIVR